MKLKLPLNEFLSLAKTVVNGINSNTEIASELANYSYPPDKISKMQNLIDKIEDANRMSKKDYNEHLESFHKFDLAYDEVEKEYAFRHKLAKVAFQDHDQAKSELMLDGIRRRSFVQWYEQADALYSGLLSNEEYLAVMKDFNTSAEILKPEYDKIKKLADIHSEYLREKGEAAEAVLARDIKIDELDELLKGVVKISRVVFENKPEALQKIGL